MLNIWENSGPRSDHILKATFYSKNEEKLKFFSDQNQDKILPVNPCSCQLIAWVFQYAPGSAEDMT